MTSPRIKIGNRVINLSNIIQAVLDADKGFVWLETVNADPNCGCELMLSGEEAQLFWDWYTRPGDCLDLTSERAKEPTT